MAKETSSTERELDLLYPFYLDTDMSMAFAAVLAGGVALESEEIDRSDETSRAVRNLRGNCGYLARRACSGEQHAEKPVEKQTRRPRPRLSPAVSGSTPTRRSSSTSMTNSDARGD